MLLSIRLLDWLHFKIYNIDFYFLLAFWTVKGKFEQNGVLFSFLTVSFCPSDWQNLFFMIFSTLIHMVGLIRHLKAM